MKDKLNYIAINGFALIWLLFAGFGKGDVAQFFGNIYIGVIWLMSGLMCFSAFVYFLQPEEYLKTLGPPKQVFPVAVDWVYNLVTFFIMTGLGWVFTPIAYVIMMAIVYYLQNMRKIYYEETPLSTS